MKGFKPLESRKKFPKNILSACKQFERLGGKMNIGGGGGRRGGPNVSKHDFIFHGIVMQSQVFENICKYALKNHWSQV